MMAKKSPAEEQFLEVLWGYYEANGRHELPWRIPELDGGFDPYKIMVSELMLQQTQVTRVIAKYYEFLTLFPNVESLAAASLASVLTAWSGLGYNRRAKFLHQSAQQIVSEYGGAFPSIETELVKLPGIGKNTAGAIMAYAFNAPVLFIETNIHTVYIHHFFHDQQGIEDSDIIDKLSSTLDKTQPRLFYWALMDYGSYIKLTHGNLNKLSKNYNKQSKFEGSLRQVRGQLIRALITNTYSHSELKAIILDDRLDVVLQDLLSEGMIEKAGTNYCLSSNMIQ